MKKLIATYVLLIAFSASAFAIQTPAQQSANVVKAVVAAILADNNLSALSIKKILLKGDGAKAELLAQDGKECFAIPYLVKADAHGAVSVEVDKTSTVICK